ncbi:MAG: hypothetical protein GMKNLPBB_01226 [Myxococcota bacterium]|nr:hypothetical protein [Myxococcota bacterium]
MVFAGLHSSEGVLHDLDNPAIVYQKLDLKAYEPEPGDNEAQRRSKWSLRKKTIDGARDEIASALKSIAAKIEKRTPAFTSREAEIRRLFSRSDGPAVFRAAAGRIRFQDGMRDRFEHGLIAMGRWQPLMERALASQGAPVELVALTFVESMFNTRAYSKVGAAGVWQLMPATARLYIRVKDSQDERRDPAIASLAAAKVLVFNYKMLKSWPLAITGYNTGPYRVKKAVEQVGDDLTDIVERFDDDGFQFASSNFYAEFLAALDIFRNHEQVFGKLKREPPLAYDELELPDYVTLVDLEKYGVTDVDQFKRLNPSYMGPVLTGAETLPRGAKIRLPPGTTAAARAAYEKIPGKFKRDKPEVRKYIVRRGDTLDAIARRLELTVECLRQSNGGARGKLRLGQVLKLPHADGCR